MYSKNLIPESILLWVNCGLTAAKCFVTKLLVCSRAWGWAKNVWICSSFVETNIQGTLNTLQAARHLGISRFVHTSTSEVYGTAQVVPITENHPLNAQSPYAATKIAADQLALSFHRSFGLPVSIVRPFNTFGPRQSARAVIPTIITQLLAGKTTIKLGAVTPTRDFNFVTDTVKGFQRIS